MSGARAYAYGTDVIESMLVPRVEDLCRLLAPDGVRAGHEWQAINPTRADARRGSFSINLHTGRWAEFAEDKSSSRDFPCLSLICYLQIQGDGPEAFGQAILWAKDYLGLTGRNPDPVKLAAINQEAERKRTQRQIDDDTAREP